MKTRTAFNISNDVLERFNEKTKKVFPNKSALVERLIVEWMDRVEKEEKKAKEEGSTVLGHFIVNDNDV